MHKTGTTALQRFFHENRDYLKDNKVHYFSDSLPDYYFVSSLKGQVEQNYAKKRIKELIDIQGCDVLFSCESLIESEKIPHILDSYFKEFEIYKKYNIKIIYYLRRQDYWIESSFNQISKTKEWPQLLFKEYNEKCGLEFYLNQIFNWERVFGTENLILKIYKENQDFEWLFKNFLEVLNIQYCQELKIPEKKNLNSSINSEIIQALIICKDEFENQGMIDSFIELSSNYKSDNSSDYYFTSEEREEFLMKFKDFNNLISTKYLRLNGEELFSSEIQESSFVFDYETSYKKTIRLLCKILIDKCL